MIAPLDQMDTASIEKRRLFHRARRMIAHALLPASVGREVRAPRISAWRAWLFAAWVVTVTAVYFVRMLGAWQPPG
jgi:hypothetical protein